MFSTKSAMVLTK